MFRHYVCMAIFLAVAGHVTVAQSTATSSSSSICNSVVKCYVNGSVNKVCDRSKRTCNPCLYEVQTGLVVTSTSPYSCYGLDDDGMCPQGTTKCETTLETPSTSDEEPSPTGSLDTEPVATPPTTTSTRRRSPASSPPSSTNMTETTPSPSRKRTTTISNSTSTSNDTRETPSSSSPTTPKTPAPISSSSSDSSDPSDSSSDSAPASASSKPTTSKKRSSSADQTTEQVQAAPKSLNLAPSTEETKSRPSSPDHEAGPENQSSNTAAARSSAGIPKIGVVLAILGGAGALLAFAAFVFWKKKRESDDSDDEAPAYPSTKPLPSRNVVSLPSAASSATAYAAPTTYPEYHNPRYGTHASRPTATHHTGGSTVPISYGSPSSIDMDGDEHVARRTDSILGGTGVMASSNASSMHTPFEFTGGPSPTPSDDARDAWGNHVGSSFRQKRTASTASVEF